MKARILNPRRICFVTGTRADFGLMATTLRAITASERLRLQLIATGMHLDPAHGGGGRGGGGGGGVGSIRAAGFSVDKVVSWPRAASAGQVAEATGGAIARLACAFSDLKSEIVLLVGDRVEAFAAASAAALSGRVVAQVHGGDRALGQLDDSLRHAITKLAHLHFPATPASAARLLRLGEDPRRIHRVGSPGIDGITVAATPKADLATCFPERQGQPFALLVLHPTSPDADIEFARARLLLRATLGSGIPRIVIIGPNNDPGCKGILRCWREADDVRVTFHPDIPRPRFLGLMRDAAFLIGNSSSGIIEAASFGAPVLDVGDRQLGRERGPNVRNVPFQLNALRRAIAAIWRDGHPLRFPRRNIYGGGAVGEKIARVLESVALDDAFRRKLITY